MYGYGVRSGEVADPAVNLYTVKPDGADPAQLTSDGNSLRPLWKAQGIVYDRLTSRGAGALPTHQLWLLHGGHSTQLTHITSQAPVAALVPVAASANLEAPIAPRW